MGHIFEDLNLLPINYTILKNRKLEGQARQSFKPNDWTHYPNFIHVSVQYRYFIVTIYHISIQIYNPYKSYLHIYKKK